MKLSMTVYRHDDGPVKNPKEYFKESELREMEPYHIFTGAGFLVKYCVPHECDCPYCAVAFDTEEQFFKTREEMDKWIGREKEEIESIEDVFYARVVRQNQEDAFKPKEAPNT